MRRIIALLLLSGLAAMLASGQEAPTGLTTSDDSFPILRQADRDISRTGERTYHARISLGTRYQRSESFTEPVDYTLKPSDTDTHTHAVSTGAYTFRTTPGQPAAGQRFERGDSFAAITPLFDADTIDILVSPHWNGVKEDIILDRDDPIELSWHIDTDARVEFRNGGLTFTGTAGERFFAIPPPTANDDSGMPVPVDVSYEKDTLTYRLNIPPEVTWPIILDPSIEVTAGRDGRVQRTSQATYAEARDTDSGIMNGTSLFVGQNGASGMSVYRSFVSFPIPELTTADACTLYLNGTLNASVTNFDIHLLGASAYRSSLDSEDFSHFDGRAAGSAHTGTILNDTWSSTSFSSGWNGLVFNDAGLDSIHAAAGDTLWIMLLSSEDYANSEPSDEEYVAFESSAHATDKPYLALMYTTDEPDPNHFTAINDGRIRSLADDLYATARDTLAAMPDGNWVQAGQQKSLADKYSVYRGFLSFPLPTLYSVQAGTLYVHGYSDQVTGDEFDITLVGASSYGPLLDTADFTRFDGRTAGAAHTGTILNNTWNSAAFALDWNAIVFNQAGLDSILAASGDTLRIAMISNDDYANTAPDSEEYLVFESSITSGKEPYLSLTYLSGLIPPDGFTMTALDDSTIVCTWNDISGETGYTVVSWPDETPIHTLAANATADTITGLDPNTVYRWAVLADSLGVTGLSQPDSAATLLAPPELFDISISPVSSDTLRITIPEPANAVEGDTGMEVAAISGDGADSSSWLTGTYRYLDGGLDCDSTYVYRVRLRNRDGIPSGWSADITMTMNGLDSLVVPLAGDVYDDYAIDGGTGRIDSTLVRAGSTVTGESLDGWLMFTLPWQVQKGGIDSLFVTLTRTDEESARTPSLIIAAITGKYPDPTETLDLSSQPLGTETAAWTVPAGTGERRTPDLRQLFREWQDTEPIRDYPTRFGIRLGSGSNPDSVRAVFLDASHPSYDQDTYLTIYYTPGNPDSLDAAPSLFDMTVVSPDSIAISWEDRSEYELGFVLIDALDITPVAQIDTLAENTTSAGVGGLTPNSVYQWFIRAFTAVDDSSSAPVSTRTLARTPGVTTLSALNDSSLLFVIDPADNPPDTEFAVQDSLSGLYVDGTGIQDTLRAGQPDEWAWRTWTEWGAAAGDTLTGLPPDSLFVLRAKARTSE